jgi:hypothetical protein
MNLQETGVYRLCRRPLIGRSRVYQRSRSLNVRAGASFPPGEKTPQCERDSGPNQKRAAERGQAGDRLSYKAGHLSGLSESQDLAQPIASRILDTLKTWPLAQHELCAGIPERCWYYYPR